MYEPTRKFETERTRQLRAGKRDAEEEDTLDLIERFGCSIIHVRDANQDRPYFSYTVGVFDTCGKPEIITAGLTEQAAHSMVNEAVSLMREDGVDLSIGRHRDLLGDVECEFRPVDPKWVKHLMGWATWYNGGADFPVLQAVYPDLQNRFPGDPEFNEFFTQPLLQPDALQTRVEEDFWASNDPKSSLFDWKFPDPPHTGVYLSKAVESGKEAVTYVSHDLDDGSWQLLGDTMTESGGVLACFHHSIDKDPSLKELADLPIGWYAERSEPGQPWVRSELPPEDPSEA